MAWPKYLHLGRGWGEDIASVSRSLLPWDSEQKMTASVHCRRLNRKSSENLIRKGGIDISRRLPSSLSQSVSLPIHPFLNWWAGQAMPVGISEDAWVAGKRIRHQKCCKTTGIFIVYLTESLEIRSPVLAPCFINGLNDSRLFLSPSLLPSECE